MQSHRYANSSPEASITLLIADLPVLSLESDEKILDAHVQPEIRACINRTPHRRSMDCIVLSKSMYIKFVGLIAWLRSIIKDGGSSVFDSSNSPRFEVKNIPNKSNVIRSSSMMRRDCVACCGREEARSGLAVFVTTYEWETTRSKLKASAPVATRSSFEAGKLLQEQNDGMYHNSELSPQKSCEPSRNTIMKSESFEICRFRHNRMSASRVRTEFIASRDRQMRRRLKIISFIREPEWGIEACR
jgi:hypothetical protein